MSKVKIILAAIFFSISLIVFTGLLLLVVIPEYHGSLFHFGKCRITDHTTDYDHVSWKDCSCGVFCTSKFPCSSMIGTFTQIGRDSSREGTFFSDYAALIRGCYKFPYNGECQDRPTENERFIRDWTNKFPQRYRNKTFDCYGLGTSFYPVQSNIYHASLGHVAFFPPLAFVFLGFFLLFKSSKVVRGSTCCIVPAEEGERLLPPSAEATNSLFNFGVKHPPIPTAPSIDYEEPPPYHI